MTDVKSGSDQSVFEPYFTHHSCHSHGLLRFYSHHTPNFCRFHWYFLRMKATFLCLMELQPISDHSIFDFMSKYFWKNLGSLAFMSKFLNIFVRKSDLSEIEYLVRVSFLLPSGNRLGPPCPGSQIFNLIKCVKITLYHFPQFCFSTTFSNLDGCATGWLPFGHAKLRSCNQSK